jgi:hypothetical protein
LELNATPDNKDKEKKATFFGSAILLCRHCSGISHQSKTYFTFLILPAIAITIEKLFKEFLKYLR